MSPPHYSHTGELLVLVCGHVLDQKRPILAVFHNLDDDWQFMCGEGHSEADFELIKPVGRHHLIDEDPTLAEVLDLVPGMEAYRAAKGSPWKRRVFEATIH